MFIASMGFLSYSIGRCFFDIDVVNPVIGQTMAFLTLGLSQLIHAFNVQSRKSLFITGFFSNLKLIFAVLVCTVLEVITVTVPTFTEFFKTRCLNTIQWLIVVTLSLLPLLISEIEKYLDSKEIKIYKKNI
jgi:Ca2+-transporting ATPase